MLYTYALSIYLYLSVSHINHFLSPLISSLALFLYFLCHSQYQHFLNRFLYSICLIQTHSHTIFILSPPYTSLEEA